MTEIYGIIHNKKIKENEALIFSTEKSFEKITGTYPELKIITKDKVLLLNNANIMFSPEKKILLCYNI